MELLDYHCFNGISKEEKDKILTNSKKILLPSKHFLYYTGDVCEELLFLRSGTVRVYIQPRSLSADEMTLYELESGSQCIVNLFSLISSTTTLATAQTTTPIEGWLIPKEDILWLIDNSKSFRDFKMDMVHKRLNALIALVTDIKFSNIEQQLLNWLYVQGVDKIKITHEKIASIIGVTRETVSRNLKKLEEKGCIILGRGMIIMA